MLKFLLPAVVLACLSAPSYADNCEDLRAQIDAKIKAAGVASYSVAVVDSAASAPGKVVGSCARGQKKIMYAVNAAPTALQTKPPVATTSAPVAAASAVPAKKPAVAVSKSGDAILTECKDGTVSKGGSCKK
jgi:Protein of unknown function (DUF1161)